MADIPWLPADPLPAVAGTMVLVEGRSDQNAVIAAARLSGIDLPGSGVAVVAMGGVTNIGHYLRAVIPGSRVFGLCDEAEVPFVGRALSGVLGQAVPDDLSGTGFQVCRADLEDELIRALGMVAIEHLLARRGELRSFRTLQHQPAQRDRPAQAQFRRFLGSGSTRKIRYAALLTEGIGADRLPEPIATLVADVAAAVSADRTAGPT